MLLGGMLFRHHGGDVLDSSATAYPLNEADRIAVATPGRPAP